MTVKRKKSKKLYASNWLKNIRRKRNLKNMYKLLGKKRTRPGRQEPERKDLSL